MARDAAAHSSPLALSIVLSTLGNYGLLRRVLDGYTRQSASPESFEMVVVTDAADPEPETVAKAIGSRPFPVRQIIGPVPGLSANRNFGLEAAHAPLVLFTDNDTVPVRHLIREHLRWHRRYPHEEVAVLGRVRWAPELDVTTFMRWLDTGIQFDFANIKGREAGWGRFVGANVSVKRSFAIRVGPFDQEHFPYGYEDTDWAYRASKLGLRVLYNRRAVVDHLRDMSLEFWQKRARRVAMAEHTFTQLHPELPPWFHTMFSGALQTPPVRGRGVRYAPFVPRRALWVGPKVWKSVDLFYKQAIAPAFLAGWAEAQSAITRANAPDLSEFDTY